MRSNAVPCLPIHDSSLTAMYDYSSAGPRRSWPSSAAAATRSVHDSGSSFALAAHRMILFTRQFIHSLSYSCGWVQIPNQSSNPLSKLTWFLYQGEAAVLRIICQPSQRFHDCHGQLPRALPPGLFILPPSPPPLLSFLPSSLSSSPFPSGTPPHWASRNGYFNHTIP